MPSISYAWSGLLMGWGWWGNTGVRMKRSTLPIILTAPRSSSFLPSGAWICTSSRVRFLFFSRRLVFYFLDEAVSTREFREHFFFYPSSNSKSDSCRTIVWILHPDHTYKVTWSLFPLSLSKTPDTSKFTTLEHPNRYTHLLWSSTNHSNHNPRILLLLFLFLHNPHTTRPWSESHWKSQKTTHSPNPSKKILHSQRRPYGRRRRNPPSLRSSPPNPGYGGNGTIRPTTTTTLQLNSRRNLYPKKINPD